MQLIIIASSLGSICGVIAIFIGIAVTAFSIIKYQGESLINIILYLTVFLKQFCYYILAGSWRTHRKKTVYVSCLISFYSDRYAYINIHKLLCQE